MKFELLEKPILLVGDCHQEWIDDHAARINAKVSKYAFGCVYHGPRTFGFQIPFETGGNSYRFNEPEQQPRYSVSGIRVLSRNVRGDREAVIRQLYPEMAAGADLPNGPLANIKLHFARVFATWEISLPENDVIHRQRGKINQAGWAIWYLFGSDEKGEYLDYYCAHRMTSDGHVRVYENGDTEGLGAIACMRRCSEDPEEDARLKKEQHEEDMRIDAMLRAKGFGIEGDENGGVQIQRYQRVMAPKK